MRVLMMPDYREGNPYQQLLVDAIEKRDVQVVFPQGYRRVFPIFRAVREQHPSVQVLHLHWLELYLRGNHPFLKLVYALKFLIDVLLTRLTGTRLVWTIHDQLEHENSFPLLERWVRSILISVADRLIVHSQSALTSLTQEYTFNPTKVDVIAHGHYRTTYSKPIDQIQARKQLNLPLKGKLYLHLGALRPYKGIEHLLEVWQANHNHLADATLLIAGLARDSAYLQKLQSLISQIKQVVFYPQFIEDREIYLFFSAADLIVLPYKRILTSGSVILAMSYSKPVIAPRLGSIPEVLGAADWLLYEPTNPQGLSDAIQKSRGCCLHDLQTLTAQACDRLDWDAIGTATAQCYYQCFSDVQRLVVSANQKLGR